MKKFLAILILIFTLQTPSQGDDIRDFQIEGMSIGDSALDYFSEQQIKNSKKNYYNDDKFFPSELEYLSSFKTYDAIQIAYKSKDKQYKLYQVSGFIDFPKNIKDCYKKNKEIVEEVSKLFPNVKAKEKKEKHSGDPSGKSIITYTSFYLDSGNVQISCTDWSKKIGYMDVLRISITTKEFDTWVRDKANK